MTPAQRLALITSWQRNHGLKVDGILGPKTAASIAALGGPTWECPGYRAAAVPRSFAGRPGGHFTINLIEGEKPLAVETTLINRIILYALDDDGKGGIGGNNAGPYVKGLREFCDFPVNRTGPWCAIFVSAKTKQAAESLDRPLDFDLSRGAGAFVRNVGKSPGGSFITTPEPGFAAWRKGLWGHIRIITGYDASTDTMHYVGGNERGDRVRVGSMKRGSWRKNLKQMATIK